MTVSNLAALGFATALLAGLLLLGTRAERLLRRRGIAIITRLTGLFLSAIAAGMILDGVKSTVEKSLLPPGKLPVPRSAASLLLRRTWPVFSGQSTGIRA